MSAYADTSFLFSLYVLDANSGAAAARMKSAPLPLLIIPLGEIELANAISLRVFRRELSAGMAKAAYSLFTSDLRNGILALLPIPALLFERSKKLARVRTPHLGTRTIDILHVAAAVLIGAESFYTFDQHQARLAKAEHLTVP